MTDPQGQSVVADGAAATETVVPVASAVGADTGWFDALPDGLKAEPALTPFKGKPISAIVESHINAQKLIGGSLRMPGKDATPEDVAKFHAEAYAKLGRPESVDKYAVKLPVVDGVTVTEDDVKAFLPVAHKLGLNNAQVEELVKYNADRQRASLPDSAAAYESCLKALTEGDANAPGWGSTADRYINTAKRTLETMFHPTVAAKIVASGVGNDPEFVRGLARIGKELIEDGLILGEEKGITQDGSGLLKELETMMGDSKSAYFDRTHPEHDKAVQRAMDIRQYLGSTATR